MRGDASATSLSVAFFGHDANESTVVKRANAFLAEGCCVEGFMFRRARAGLARRVAWPVVELGTTEDRSYLRRLPTLAAGVFRALRAARRLRRADIFYARNIDMLAVALAVKGLSHAPARVVYEVLDIQRPFVRDDITGLLFRCAERILLRASALLVVSSPDFVDKYFAPRQRRRAGWFLLENKLPLVAARDIAPRKTPGPPWQIVWAGTLRCRRSFATLCDLADALGEKVRVHMAGRPSLQDLSVEEIERAARSRSNLVYTGGYDNPADLGELYGPAHFSWCIDYTDAGFNSDWLIPNRVYEGGLHGVLALARQDTATGRLVEARELGYTLSEPVGASLAEFLSTLTVTAFVTAQSSVAAAPMELFVDTHDTARLVASMKDLRGERPAAPVAPLDRTSSSGPLPT